VPLTDSSELTDRDGGRWLVYIEGVPRPAARFRTVPSGFPGRRLRFDSTAESRVVTPVPAGSPFLTDERLQRLLDRSEPVNAVRIVIPASAGPARRLVNAIRRSVASLTGSVRRGWQLRSKAPARLLGRATPRSRRHAVAQAAVHS
jgi:hypothetical protein